VEDTGIRFNSREYDHLVLIPKESKMWFFKEIEKFVPKSSISSFAVGLLFAIMQSGISRSSFDIL
jgi:hypothetical protein